MPRFSDDDVIDFMVVEALQARSRDDIAAAEQKRKQDEFRKSHKQFDPNNPQGG